ncbi:Gp138 family membrane-puncturing spike protein [Lacticaseibacillus zhaodongensis]|uniref:Gp138 family membrane-puncturing spike protein n=1 Tax=Lacticaseibacillus zhaodongensis TaxID=2668065 RepID=UPI0012D327FE|nr:Gp138 family membrane-puncturing spike protein [Lacticaseibacillus zhaodongensis]
MAARNYDTQFIKSLMQNLNVGINVSQLGRIVNLNGNTADVQPLAHDLKTDNKRAMLLDVPITRNVTDAIKAAEDTLKVGDAVIVVFLDRSMENWTGGAGDFSLDSGRMHDLNDAVIVGVF